MLASVKGLGNIRMTCDGFCDGFGKTSSWNVQITWKLAMILWNESIAFLTISFICYKIPACHFWQTGIILLHFHQFNYNSIRCGKTMGLVRHGITAKGSSPFQRLCLVGYCNPNWNIGRNHCSEWLLPVLCYKHWLSANVRNYFIGLGGSCVTHYKGYCCIWTIFRIAFNGLITYFAGWRSLNRLWIHNNPGPQNPM